MAAFSQVNRLKKEWRAEWEAEQEARHTSPEEIRASIEAKVAELRARVAARKAAEQRRAVRHEAQMLAPERRGDMAEVVKAWRERVEQSPLPKD